MEKPAVLWRLSHESGGVVQDMVACSESSTAQGHVSQVVRALASSKSGSNSHVSNQAKDSCSGRRGWLLPNRTTICTLQWFGILRFRMHQRGVRQSHSSHFFDPPPLPAFFPPSGYILLTKPACACVWKGPFENGRLGGLDTRHRWVVQSSLNVNCRWRWRVAERPRKVRRQIEHPKAPCGSYCKSKLF